MVPIAIGNGSIPIAIGKAEERKLLMVEMKDDRYSRLFL